MNWNATLMKLGGKTNVNLILFQNQAHIAGSYKSIGFGCNDRDDDNDFFLSFLNGSFRGHGINMDQGLLSLGNHPRPIDSGKITPWNIIPRKVPPPMKMTPWKSHPPPPPAKKSNPRKKFGGLLSGGVFQGCNCPDTKKYSWKETHLFYSNKRNHKIIRNYPL